MAVGYDRERGRVVIFGGVIRGVAPFELVEDTWSFDGTEWTEQNDGPVAFVPLVGEAGFRD